jgi:drug/metabolite transporter (DMT)-like permease
MLWHKPGERLSSKEHFWIWLRGISGVLSLSSYYYGVLHIPLSLASLFSNSSPLYITALAVILGDERLSRFRKLSLIFGFCGVGLVGLGAGLLPITDVANFDIFMAILSGPLAAGAYFSIRMLRRIRIEQIMLSLGLAGSFASIFILFWCKAHFPTTAIGWSWLIASVFPALMAQFSLTMAFKIAPASQIAPLQYSAPVFSGILGFLFLDENIPQLCLLGMIVVLIFGLVLPYIEARLNQDKFQPKVP